MFVYAAHAIKKSVTMIKVLHASAWMNIDRVIFSYVDIWHHLSLMEHGFELS